jgi:hypothetical protein
VDVMRADTVNRDLDRLLSTRASEDTTSDPTTLEPGYVESVRRFNARVRAENRAAWLAFHEDQADRLRRNLGALVAHHKAEADKYRNHHQHEGAA